MKSMFAARCRRRQPTRRSAPLEEQFAELRDTWKSSIEKWTEFAEESAKGAMP